MVALARWLPCMKCPLGVPAARSTPQQRSALRLRWDKRAAAYCLRWRQCPPSPLPRPRQNLSSLTHRTLSASPLRLQARHTPPTFSPHSFFAGDSMMEGIAPHVALWLKKHGIASINRSRFSTGLAYPNAKTRDWPQEIETTLAANPRIRLLAMFIGANDQLNIASDERRGHWLRFGSPEWEQAYRSRIARIMAAAQRSGTAVIWLGLPLMRQSSYDSKMQYITAITASEVQANGGTFLPTSRMLAPDGAYTDSVDIDGHVTAVRTKDGVHFTRAGQHLIAQVGIILDDVAWEA